MQSVLWVSHGWNLSGARVGGREGEGQRERKRTWKVPVFCSMSNSIAWGCIKQDVVISFPSQKSLLRDSSNNELVPMKWYHQPVQSCRLSYGVPSSTSSPPSYWRQPSWLAPITGEWSRYWKQYRGNWIFFTELCTVPVGMWIPVDWIGVSTVELVILWLQSTFVMTYNKLNYISRFNGRSNAFPKAICVASFLRASILSHNMRSYFICQNTTTQKYPFIIIIIYCTQFFSQSDHYTCRCTGSISAPQLWHYRPWKSWLPQETRYKISRIQDSRQLTFPRSIMSVIGWVAECYIWFIS